MKVSEPKLNQIRAGSRLREVVVDPGSSLASALEVLRYMAGQIKIINLNHHLGTSVSTWLTLERVPNKPFHPSSCGILSYTKQGAGENHRTSSLVDVAFDHAPVRVCVLALSMVHCQSSLSESLITHWHRVWNVLGIVAWNKVVPATAGASCPGYLVRY